MKNKKIVAALGFICLFVLSASSASAKYVWKDYFSFAEKTAISQKARVSVLNSIKNDRDWKDAILDITDDAYIRRNGTTSSSSSAPSSAFFSNLAVGGASTDNYYGLLNINAANETAGLSINYPGLTGWQ